EDASIRKSAGATQAWPCRVLICPTGEPARNDNLWVIAIRYLLTDPPVTRDHPIIRFFTALSYPPAMESEHKSVHNSREADEPDCCSSSSRRPSVMSVKSGNKYGATRMPRAWLGI